MSLVEEFHRAHKQRLARMQAPPRVEPKMEVRQPPVVEFDTVEAWIKRQKAIPLPQAKEPWFSITAEYDPAGPSMGQIMSAVAKHFNVSKNDLMSASRSADVAYPRQIAYYLCRTLTLKSFPEIGRKIGGRDHTTALHGFRKIQRLMRTDLCVAYDVAHVEAML